MSKLSGNFAETPSWEAASRKRWDLLLPHAEALRKGGAHFARIPRTADISDSTFLWKMAEANQQRGDYRSASPPQEEAVEALERVLGAEHPNTLMSVNNLAGLYERQGRYGAAEPLYRRALEAGKRVLGAEHPIREYSEETLPNCEKS